MSFHCGHCYFLFYKGDGYKEAGLMSVYTPKYMVMLLRSDVIREVFIRQSDKSSALPATESTLVELVEKHYQG